jgi:hypothetical protein
MPAKGGFSKVRALRFLLSASSFDSRALLTLAFTVPIMVFVIVRSVDDGGTSSDASAEEGRLWFELSSETLDETSIF